MNEKHMLTRAKMTHQVETKRGGAGVSACVYLTAGNVKPQSPSFGRTINLDWRCAP